MQYDKVYNNLADLLSKELRHDGYTVQVSQAYPAESEPRNIIWGNAEKGKAYRFEWAQVGSAPTLQVAAYNNSTEITDWETIETVQAEYYDITPDEEEQVAALFLQAYRADASRKHIISEQPSTKPKLESQLAKFFTSAGGAAILFFVLKLLLRGCSE